MGYDPDKNDVMFLKLTREEAVAMSRAISHMVNEGLMVDYEIGLLDRVFERIGETKCQPEGVYDTIWLFTPVRGDGEINGATFAAMNEEDALDLAKGDRNWLIQTATVIGETEVKLSLAPVPQTKLA